MKLIYILVLKLIFLIACFLCARPENRRIIRVLPPVKLNVRFTRNVEAVAHEIRALQV